MKLSARNSIPGTIIQVKKGPISTEVVIETKEGQHIVASITTGSAESLDLEVGRRAHAIIKATNVIVGIDD